MAILCSRVQAKKFAGKISSQQTRLSRSVSYLKLVAVPPGLPSHWDGAHERVKDRTMGFHFSHGFLDFLQVLRRRVSSEI